MRPPSFLMIVRLFYAVAYVARLLAAVGEEPFGEHFGDQCPSVLIPLELAFVAETHRCSGSVY
jgi:hypothetical protein